MRKNGRHRAKKNVPVHECPNAPATASSKSLEEVTPASYLSPSESPSFQLRKNTEREREINLMIILVIAEWGPHI